MNLIEKEKQIRTFLLSCLIILLSACGGESDENKKKTDGEDTAKSKKELSEGDKDQGKENAREHQAVLPTTLQVASSFKKAGLPYKEGLVLDPKDVEDFVDPDRKKLIFGAYSADLAYLVINKKGKRASKTMKALMKLSDDLNISSVFNTEKLADRFQSNLDKRDSLIQLIIEVQERFDTYVAKNQNRKLRTIAYAGGWTEAIYLAAKSDLSDKKKVHLEVEEQMTVLEKLLKALERDLEGKGNLADLVDVLKDIKNTYEENAPEPGKKLSDELMKSLKKKAMKARRIITKGSS